MFMSKFRSKIKNLFRGNGGFTLIELIIVIGIMGFLVVMIAPRMAGVLTGSVDHVCDSNQTRLQQVLGTYTESNGNLPNGLTNLIINDGAADFDDDWMVDDNNRSTGVEIFSEEFVDMTKAALHALTEAEAEELMGMGITTVYNLNLNKDVLEYNGNEMNWHEDITDEGAFMDEADVEEGLMVLMYGAGIDDGDDVRQPELMYRIIMGVGPDSALIEEGLITQAGMCPGGLQRSGHFAYNNYNIVIPRLAATVADLDPDDEAELEFVNSETGQTKEFTYEAEEVWKATTLCPEGHTVAGTSGTWVLQ